MGPRGLWEATVIHTAVIKCFHSADLLSGVRGCGSQRESAHSHILMLFYCMHTCASGTSDTDKQKDFPVLTQHRPFSHTQYIKPNNTGYSLYSTDKQSLVNYSTYCITELQLHRPCLTSLGGRSPRLQNCIYFIETFTFQGAIVPGSLFLALCSQ